MGLKALPPANQSAHGSMDLPLTERSLSSPLQTNLPVSPAVFFTFSFSARLFINSHLIGRVHHRAIGNSKYSSRLCNIGIPHHSVCTESTPRSNPNLLLDTTARA